MQKSLLILLTSHVLVNAAPPEHYDVLQYINPLIGSANGGTPTQHLTQIFSG
jgi:hypothetical protein